MIDNGGDGQMTPLLRLAAGAGAGIVGMSATYPLDMVISSHTTGIPNPGTTVRHDSLAKWSCLSRRNGAIQI